MASREERLGQWSDARFRSRSELARESGMTPQQLNDYLSGRRKPGADVLARWAELGLDLAWYLNGTGQMDMISREFVPINLAVTPGSRVHAMKDPVATIDQIDELLLQLKNQLLEERKDGV
jgi:transcriptional regulator with XRE-family HTH domain